MKPIHLRTELLVQPIGLLEPRPRLSWRLSPADVKSQASYRVLVSRDAGVTNGDLWDSGVVQSDRTTDVRYVGPPLGSGERAYWKVIATDDAGNSGESDVAFWETGLFLEADWQASWIMGDLLGGRRTMAPTPFFRREFAAETRPVSARLYVACGGVFEARLNRKRVGDAELTPGWTDYPKRLNVQAYDVTELVAVGKNALAFELGDGWWCGNVEWRGRQLYGDRPILRAQLVITSADGSTRVVGTDREWHYAYGPRLQADLLMGEHEDARLAFMGYDQPGFEAGNWRPAIEASAPKATLAAPICEPVRATKTLKPISVDVKNHWPAADYIVDMGQNMVGRVRIRLKGEAGHTIRVRHAEVLNADGTLYTVNLRTALQTDYYTLKGDPEGEVFEPKFTFHGFRYVEIQSPPAPITVEDVDGVVMHTDYAVRGSFRCSDELLNQLWHNIEWGWRGNSVDVPTDCPQRDERLGWTGDAQVFVRTACALGDVQAIFSKYMQDMEDSQGNQGAIPPVTPSTGVIGQDGGPAWSDAVMIVPWRIYLHYGDATILERHYETMKRFVDFLASTAKDHIRCYDGYQGFRGFGDWLSINAETPNDLIGTAFYALSAGLLSKAAVVLGYNDDAHRYATLREDIKAAFQRRYVTAEGVMAPATQTACVLALHFDLLTPEMRPKIVQALVDDIGRRGYKLSTGFVGSSYLPYALADNGRLDIAYRLLHQKEWPSWLYAVTKGATTIWERWDGWTHDKGFQDPGMNSFNHYAYGAIGEWLVSTVCGIDTDESRPGFKRILLRPRPGGELTFAEAKIDCPHGMVESSWDYRDGKKRFAFVVPPNTTAEITLPEDVSDRGPFVVGPGEHRYER
jgi:alpha-L-rhamnosidase